MNQIKSDDLKAFAAGLKAIKSAHYTPSGWTFESKRRYAYAAFTEYRTTLTADMLDQVAALECNHHSEGPPAWVYGSILEFENLAGLPCDTVEFDGQNWNAKRNGNTVALGELSGPPNPTNAAIALPTPPGAETPVVQIDRADLLTVAKAADSEATRYALNTVCFDGPTSAIVATNGHWLITREQVELPDARSVIVKPPIWLAAPAFGKPDTVGLSYSKPDKILQWVQFHIGPWTLHYKESEGLFPKWQMVLPPPGTVHIEFTKHAAAFAQVIRKTGYLSDKFDGNRGVYLAVQPGGFTTNWQIADNRHAAVFVPCSIGQPDDEFTGFTFAPDYLIDLLDMGFTRWTVVDHKRATVATIPGRDNLKCVIMPLTKEGLGKRAWKHEAPPFEQTIRLDIADFATKAKPPARGKPFKTTPKAKDAPTVPLADFEALLVKCGQLQAERDEWRAEATAAKARIAEMEARPTIRRVFTNNDAKPQTIFA